MIAHLDALDSWNARATWWHTWPATLEGLGRAISKTFNDKTAEGKLTLEAQVAAGAWKGRLARPWRTVTPQKGLTGQPLEDWVDELARRFPGAVN